MAASDLSTLVCRAFPLCLFLFLAGLFLAPDCKAAEAPAASQPFIGQQKADQRDMAGQKPGNEAPASRPGIQPGAQARTSTAHSAQRPAEKAAPESARDQAEILLDPGHSKLRQGATSCTGLGEFAYNNGLVHFLYGHLGRAGIRVDVTRDPEGEASLTQRALMARGRKLLLSIHHDSTQPQFIKMVDGRPFSDKASGYSIFVSSKNAFFSQSLAAARILGQALYDLGLRPSTHHGEAIAGENRPILDPLLGIYQYDNLIVLKQAQAPAVLLEAGVIVEPGNEVLVRTTDFQTRVAMAVEQTIRQALAGFSDLQ